jgi:hypothetical protein
MSIVRGRDGTAYYANATTAFVSEAMTETAYVYQINNNAKRVWDPNTPLVLTATAGTLDLTWGDRGIDHFAGRVKLTATGATVTCSGAYVASASFVAVADIYSWALNINRAMGEVTPLAAGWRDVMALGMTVTCTLSRYRTDTQFDLLGADQWVILKLDEDGVHGFWVKALRSTFGWTKATGAVDQEALTFEVKSFISRY